MTSRIKTLLPFLKNKKHGEAFKKSFYIITTALFALMVYSIMAWSDRSGWPNIATWLVYCLALLAASSYCFLFGRWVPSPFYAIYITWVFLHIATSFINFTTPMNAVLLNGFTACVVLLFISQGSDELKSFKISLLLGGIAFLIHFIIIYPNEFFTFSLSTDGRVGSYFSNLNDVGSFFAWICIFPLFFLKKKKAWPLIIVSVVSFYSLILTGSISNILCLILSAALSMLFMFKGRKKAIFVVTLAVLIVVAIAIINLPSMSYYAERLKGALITIFTGKGYAGGDKSVSIRLQLLKDSILLFLERPIIGYGNGGVAAHSFDFQFAHNNYSEVLADYGLFSGIAYELLWFLPLIFLFKKKFTNELNLLAILIILLFSIAFQITLVTYYRKMESILIPLCFAEIFKQSKFKVHKLFVKETTTI